MDAQKTDAVERTKGIWTDLHDTANSEWTLHFYPQNEDAVEQLAQAMGDERHLLCWFNRETCEGSTTVVTATNPDAYILVHNAYQAGILIGYEK